MRRGISFDKLGQFEQAVADFNEVLRLEPNNSVAYFNRGSTYDSMGAQDQAIADFGRALELDPGQGDGDAADGPPASRQASGMGARLGKQGVGVGGSGGGSREEGPGGWSIKAQAEQRGTSRLAW